ncbi:MAG: transposase [Pseudonocardia sp.]|nr:transposase [Pseudonocardia sp.]
MLVIAGGELLVSHASGALLAEAARRSGLAKELLAWCRTWRRPLAVHDPGKIVLDLGLTVALGGDAACDLAAPRARSRSPPSPPTRWPGLPDSPCSPGPHLRAQTTPAAHPGHDRTPGDHRPPPHPQNRPHPALGPGHHHRLHPTHRTTRA